MSKIEKMAEFEDRMSVLGRDNEDMAEACRSVHNMLVNAKYVAESVFNDDVADNPEVVMSIMSAIADAVDELKAERDGEEGDGEESEEGGY